MTDDRAQLQTQSTVHRYQGLASHLRAHLTIAQDEVREDREDRTTRRALDAPDGHPAQTDACIMRVARQAPAAATGRLVGELKAKGEEKGEHKLKECLAIIQQAN